MINRLNALLAKLADQKTRIATLTADRAAGRWIDISKLERHMREAQMLELQIADLRDEARDDELEEEFDEEEDVQPEPRSDGEMIDAVFTEEMNYIAKSMIGFMNQHPGSYSFRQTLQSIIEDELPEDRPDLAARVAEKLLAVDAIRNQEKWYEAVKLAMAQFLPKTPT